MNIIILGLSITSSWGNGHATTYRGLVRALADRGHDVLFLERDVPWYAANRDLPQPPYGRTVLYADRAELEQRFSDAVRAADLVVVGSYVPEGDAVGAWVTAQARGIAAFYDIDTPVTLAALERGACAYLSVALIPRYHLYLSFTGGPTLARLEQQFGATAARPLYCAFDPQLYFFEATDQRYDLGYLGTYSDDRQPALQRLLLEPAQRWPAGRFAVAGPQYPPSVTWPPNVWRADHLPPSEHRGFYNAQRWTLNVTRAAMVRAGYAPSVRLFEAAACATPIISDAWEGIETFFVPNSEIIIARTTDDVLAALQRTPDAERRAIGERGRARVLAAHTAAQRAIELEGYVSEVKT